MNPDDIDDDKSRWQKRLLSRLPAYLRPSRDQRFLQAADTAYRQGWDAEKLAEGIEGRRSYQGLNNPAYFALQELEDLAPIPPATANTTYTGPPEPHCGRQGCTCDHTTCYVGWIEVPPAPAFRVNEQGERIEIQHKGRTVNYNRTAPCPTCRPELAHKLGRIPPPGQRTQADLAYLRQREPR